MTADEVFWNALAHFVRAQRPRLSMREEERAQSLQSLLRHAAERVPLYRDLYRANKIDIEAARA